MKKYEIVRFDLETTHGTKKEVETAYNNRDGVENEIVKSFNNLLDAKMSYILVKANVDKYGNYYLHECKCLEVNEYDENGNFKFQHGCEILDLPCVEQKLIENVKFALKYSYAYESSDNQALVDGYLSDLPELSELKDKIAENLFISGENWANGKEPDESDSHEEDGYLISKSGYDCGCGAIAWKEEKLPILKDENGEEYVDQAEIITYYVEV